MFIDAKPVGDNLAIWRQTVFNLLVFVRRAFSFYYINIVDRHVALLGTPLNTKAQNFFGVRSAWGGGASLWHYRLLTVQVVF